MRILYSLGQASLCCCKRPYFSLGCGLWRTSWLLRCINKTTNITNKSSSLNKNKTTTNPNINVALQLFLFGLSGYPLTSLKLNHLISNSYMPSWFTYFCFSAFHRCHIAQSCALVHLYRFLPPALHSLPAWGSQGAAACTLHWHASMALAQPTQLNCSKCDCSASGLAVLQNFSLLPLSDAKCFVEERDWSTSVRAEPSFIGQWKVHDYYFSCLNRYQFDSFLYSFSKYITLCICLLVRFSCLRHVVTLIFPFIF